MLNFSLTPEQIALRDKARRFALDEVLPVAWHYDEKDDLPLYILRKAWDEGIMNLTIPVKYGGQGRGLLESALVVEEISAACAGLATSIFDNSLGTEPLILSRNERLRDKYLPVLAKDFKLICFATSEPLAGSDVAGMRCKAEKSGGDYILNGTKYWITNAGVADYFSIFATVDASLGHKGIAAFLVEKGQDGVTTGRPIPKMGQRSSNTAGIHLTNVRVPAENVLAQPGEGFLMAMTTFAHTRPIIGSFGVGAARSAMEMAIDYAKKRRAFGARLADFQAIDFKIAEMYQKVETARLLTWKAAWENDSGMDPTITASIAKFYATEAAFEVVSEALQILGGYGYTRLFPVEKLLRDMRLPMIYEGTSEIQRIVVSRYLLEGYRSVMPALEDFPLLAAHDVHLEKDAVAWRCRICGHTHYGPEPPEQCPHCFFPKAAFRKVWPK
ncbi:MAG TPA: acyl-CoA dehydrogenase family protein [Syntrophales bacterium]|nr:acyl-CoA dehydrogenase family protein [Syntrophales bacterium]HQM90986.1 acyl-CoA dehydrogenase family protein [Syntrophales bacterium]